MITGFNTDVKKGDTVYHVQTEDKGIHNPLIESLIYIKGAILGSHRSYYEDFLRSETFNESTLQKILESQHRQIVAAIKRGQFRKGLSLRAYVEGSFVFNFNKAKPSDPASESSGKNSQLALNPPKNLQTQRTPKSKIVPELAPSGLPDRVLSSDTGLFFPARTHRLKSPSNRIEFANAAEIVDSPNEEGIEICVESSKEFVGGSHVDLSLSIQSRQNRMRLENVSVSVKVIGTTFSPRLYAGRTDKNGNLRMNFNLPTYSSGSAALIIQASTAFGTDEIKYLIKRK